MSENIECTFTDAHFAELVLRVIDEVEYPRLMCDGEKEAVRKGLMLLLDRQPAERVVKLTHVGYDCGLKIYECSGCHKRTYGRMNYCPNCGTPVVKSEDG